MNDISIAIVAYNDEPDVRIAVESIESHTSERIKKHIYIIDNSDMENHLKEFTERFSDVSYLFTGKNLGFGRGHNYVLKRLDSRFHAIVNPDIILNMDALGVLMEFMQEENVGMSVPRILDEKGNLLEVYRQEPTVFDLFLRMFAKKCAKKRQAYHTMQNMDYEKSFPVPFAQGSFLVVRTELFRQLGGFDERYFLYMEDADLCRRINEVSELRYCPKAAVIHKWGKGSHKKFKLFCIHVKSMIAYFGKWGWKLI